ncbi:uncharacterized protein LOC118510193 [Anopheles stephensi]|uniref:Uncharacterized protein n=1 Tax=Anopheles stephensi TaxID=30069 RepID=A0A182XYH4_ANOST|nr:uncharacterized protein LOC118510193 [Anopheles stephensi]
MLGTWVLSLGVICLLQCTVSGEPRPDFGLDATLFGTVRVSGAVGETQSVVTAIDANLYITLNSSYPRLSNLLQLTQEVGESVSERLEDILNPLATLAPSSSSEEVSLFNDVLGAVTTLEGFLSTRLTEINSEVGMLFSGYIPSQFSDALGRVGVGLRELASALGALQTAVNAVVGQNSGEMSECAPKVVRPKLVYRVVYAVRTLKAYLPVVRYTLLTTVENIALADHFVFRLTEEAADVQEPGQYVDLIRDTVDSVRIAVNNGVAALGFRFFIVKTSVSDLSSLSSLSAYSGVQQVMNSFDMTLQQIGSAVTTFNRSLVDIAEQLRLALVPDQSTPTVNNSEVVAALVSTLIANGPFARFCFYKYSELVFGLANNGLLGVEACINKEMLRLQQLRKALLEQVPLLLFDLEDIVGQLTTCNAIQSTSSRESCVSMVTSYYVQVASFFRTKFDTLFITGVAEADASKNRLLACVKVLQYEIVDGSAQSLKDQILRCAQVGPQVSQ